jgi:hypothetical protein
MANILCAIIMRKVSSFVVLRLHDNLVGRRYVIVLFFEQQPWGNAPRQHKLNLKRVTELQSYLQRKEK